jgi:23S rRNA (guanosine2251-2'-O)-methyltransferase
MDEARNDQNDLIIGRNAVFEAIKSGREIDRLFVQRGEQNPAVKRLISMAREKGAVIKEVDSKKLDFMCGGGVHQGVALSAAAHEYSTVEDILNKAATKNEKPFIIICDGVEDTHNLGAVIRTADAAGAHGVIIPKRRSASLNFTVGKTSAGALEYVPVARVANLASTIDELKEKNIFSLRVPSALSAREPSPFGPFRTRTAPHQLKGHQSPQATRACPALFLYLFRFR